MKLLTDTSYSTLIFNIYQPQFLINHYQRLINMLSSTANYER